MPDGSTLRVGRVAGLDGRDGADGASVKGDKGDPGRDGGDGQDGAPGARGAQGDPGRDGKDGASVKGDKGDRGEPGARGAQGEAGRDGRDGDIGPIPRHELDGMKIRFELERNAAGKTTRWGPWIDFRKLLPKTMGRGYGGWERSTGTGSLSSVNNGTVVSVTSNYSTSGDEGLLLVDATAGPITITLLDPTDARARPVNVKRINVNNNAVTITAANGKKVDGALSTVITTGILGNMSSFDLQPYTNGWWIV